MDSQRACERCGRGWTGTGFWMEGPHGHGLACVRCAITDRRLLVRCLRVCAVVGTILVAINQGNVIASGAWPVSLAWKIPLTYAVPFAVAMWSALNSLRGPRPPHPP